MATPIGHALAGLAVSSLIYRNDELPEAYNLKARPGGSKIQKLLYNRGAIALLSVFMAMAPDLDLIPGILQGQPILYHGGIAHSLGSGILLSLLVVALWRTAWQRVNGRWFVLEGTLGFIFTTSLLAFSTHLLLDMLGPDGREPFGIPALRPLSEARFLSPIPILLGVHHASKTTAAFAEFLNGVFSLHNMIAILWESVLTVPFILLGERRIRQRRSQTTINAYS